MKTLKQNPHLMTVIINIQTMRKVINPNYNELQDFKRLEKMDENELYTTQNSLINEYNKTFNQH